MGVRKGTRQSVGVRESGPVLSSTKPFSEFKDY